MSSKITNHDLDESVMAKQTISLPVSSWSGNSQTVTCNGVTTGNTVIVSSAPSSQNAYGKANVRCTAQASNSLTFACDRTPETDLTVNIVILGV